MNDRAPDSGEAHEFLPLEIPMQTSRESAEHYTLPPLRLGKVATAANAVWSIADHVLKRNERLTQINYLKSAENVRARWQVYEQADEYHDPVRSSLLVLKESGIIDTKSRCLDVGTADGKSLSELVQTFGDWQGDIFGVELNAEQFKNSRYWLPLYKQGDHPQGEWYMHVADAAGGKTQPKRAQFIQGNVTSLPFQSHSVELVMALYMLYHLENDNERKTALHELHRVLAPGGIFIASTSGAANKPFHRSFEKNIADRMSEYSGQKIRPPRIMNANFTSEIASDELQSEFNYVYKYEFGGSFVVNSVDKYVIYQNSLLSMYDQFYPQPPEEAFRTAAEETLADVWQRIDTDQPFTETLSRAAFICTDRELELPDGFEKLTLS